MKIKYLENEKRHILESENGYVASYRKEDTTKEQAISSFQASLLTQGFDASEIEVEENA